MTQNRSLRRAKIALQRRARHLRRDTRALAMIEMAVTLPTLLLLSFGGLEISSLMLAHTRISNIALSVADNASRIASDSGLANPQVREVDVNDVFRGAQIESGSMNLLANGRVILSSLELNDDGGQWIHWQRCYGNMNVSSAYGPQGTGATGTSFAGMGDEGSEVKAGESNPIMFVEITYRYQPAVLASLYDAPIDIDYEAAFAVRDARDTSQIFNPSPSATVATCPTGAQRKKRRNRTRHNGWGGGWGRH